MLYQKEFVTIIAVPNLLTHVQFWYAQLDVIVIVKCYIGLGGLYFCVAIGSLVGVSDRYFDSC